MLSLFVAGAVFFAGFEVEVQFSWQGQEIVRLGGVAEVTFRGRRSILCVLEVWMCKFSLQAQGNVRLRVVVVNVTVTLGLACERVLFGGAGIAKLLGRAA